MLGPHTNKNTLIVGAGSVGIVFATALQNAGDCVFFWVKPKYKLAIQNGVSLHILPQSESIHQAPVTAISSIKELSVHDFSPDEIWLCVSKTAIDSGSLDPLISNFPNARILSFQPGIDDLTKLRIRFPAHEIDGGMIGFIAFQKHRPEHLSDFSVFFPPGMPSQFYTKNAAEYVERLRQGACPARVDKNTLKKLPQMASVLNIFILFLELSDWKFKLFFKTLPLFQNTVFENMKIVNTHTKNKTPIFLNILRSSFGVRFAISIITKLMPFDLEAYLEFHFMKVRSQTIAMLKENQLLAEKYKLPKKYTTQLLKNLNA